MSLLFLLFLSHAAGLRCRAVSLPSITLVDDPDESCATLTVSVEYPKCAGTTPWIKDLNHLMAQRARTLAEYNDAVEDSKEADRKPQKGCVESSREVSGDCDLPVVVGSVISVDCRRTWADHRQSGASPEPVNVLVVGNAIRPVTLDDVIEESERSRFWSLVRQDLNEQQVDYESPEGSATLEDRHPAFYFKETHLVIDFAFAFGHPYVTVELPYAALSRVLKPEYLPRAAPSNSRPEQPSTRSVVNSSCTVGASGRSR